MELLASKSKAHCNTGPAFVILRCIDADVTESEDVHQFDCAEDEIFVSTDEIQSWDLSSILNHSTVKIKADLNRYPIHYSICRAFLYFDSPC